MLKHKSGRNNQVADALNSHRRVLFLISMTTQFSGFDEIKELYVDDKDFGEIWELCQNGRYDNFYFHNDFLFKGTRLCIPKCSLRELIIKELHSDGLGGHFGRGKTNLLVKEKYFWPTIYCDVRQLVKQCRICQTSKDKPKIQVSTLNYQSLKLHGMMLIWILWLGCCKLNEVLIPSLSLSIDFLKWHILSHINRLCMPHILLVFILMKWYSVMVSLS